MAYTYDDFQKAASGSNVNFSQYDLDLAKKYPEFGMSVLDLKKQYAGATTAEQRALINAKANQLRSSYGITPETPLEIMTEGEMILLRKYQPADACIFCNEVKPGTVMLHGKRICPTCRRELEKL